MRLRTIGWVLSATVLAAGFSGCESDDPGAEAPVASDAPTESSETSEAPPSVEPAESAPGGFDPVPIETQIASSIDAPGVVVDCPDAIEGSTGADFDCSIEGDDGLTGSVTVTLTDDTGSHYSYEGSYRVGGTSATINGSVTG